MLGVEGADLRMGGPNWWGTLDPLPIQLLDATDIEGGELCKCYP
jgi:hypothetical protein